MTFIPPFLIYTSSTYITKFRKCSAPVHTQQEREIGNIANSQAPCCQKRWCNANGRWIMTAKSNTHQTMFRSVKTRVDSNVSCVPRWRVAGPNEYTIDPSKTMSHHHTSTTLFCHITLPHREHTLQKSGNATLRTCVMFGRHVILFSEILVLCTPNVNCCCHTRHSCPCPTCVMCFWKNTLIQLSMLGKVPFSRLANHTLLQTNPPLYTAHQLYCRCTSTPLSLRAW